ncbi:hypothetical protein MXB_3572 [Myxobolus squamalis]|nr:hypothetical protein MXB_3572 [Myxobolus squamalis]
MCFEKETKAEVEERTYLSRQPFVRKLESEKEIGLDLIYPSNLDILLPKRPSWNYFMTKTCIENNEKKYFDAFVANLKLQPWAHNLSCFENNLETWRQLWRVLEKSDVITMLADARFPALHFFPPLIDYVTETLKKPAILVLNKVDIVPPQNVIGWKKYFTQIYPNLKVVCFTSFPKTPTPTPSKANHIMAKSRRKKGGFMAFGEKDFLDACKSLFPDKMETITPIHELQSDPQDVDLLLEKWNDDDSKSKFITIGLVGFPNVGKSSFLNGIRGRKVVSVSKTPGHTKYFQTIFITHDVVLCDCPGLIFPSIVDKQWQILSGVFPLSQVREPYTSVGYLAQMTDLVELLQLKHPMDQENKEWSAWDICIAWAIKRGFLTAKSGRPDVYRAAELELDPETQGLAQSLKIYSNYSRLGFNQDEEGSQFHDPNISFNSAI